ncbi:DNA double-strand break repair protein Mre11 [Halegenticoccus soli]|uniref:DNA double-strand break repair protein Mre11 n=1 Tax=Halegenticoccus soli TaxID=1985678 RepID=UPI000C6CC1C0|nr:DNA double-strand break repair protein Mre11 [Halegenticoccus soli]
MTRVIHTGDTHIGYQQYHSPERRRDFLEAFEQVVDDAVDARVDAVVHAGDLFHDRRPDLEDLLGALSALRKLDDAGIPFLAIVGNHESVRGDQWLDLFERLDLATRLGREPHVIGDTAFYGLDHVPQSRRSELEYRFEPHDAAHAALVGHGLFTPFAHANWETETVLRESNVDFDAVLLGDNHAADTATVDGTWVTYCGSTERASASEKPGRGYNLVEFDGDVDIRRRALDTRPFAFVSVELADGEGVERVREQIGQHDLDGAVVIVEITGAGEPLTPASVEAFATEKGALVARVTDRREIDAETELSVSFADPDDAVRDRIVDLGLSAAAIDIDETVRASKVADSNVREEVRTRVERLAADDPGAFERAPDAADDAERPDAPERPDAANGTGGDGVSDDGDAAERPSEGAASDADPETADADADAEAEADAEGDGTVASAADASGPPAEPEREPEPDGSARNGDQVSMEDYL